MPDSNFLTPELAQQMAGLSTIPDEQAQLEAQLQQALALRSHGQAPHSTGLGAALGGLGDVAGNAASVMQQHGLQGQQQALLAQQGTSRNAYMQAMLQALRGGQQPGQQPPGPGAPPMGPSPLPPGAMGPEY